MWSVSFLHMDCENDMGVYWNRVCNAVRCLANKYIGLCVRGGRHSVHMSLPLYQRFDSTNDDYPYVRLHPDYDSYVMWLVFSSHTEFKTREWCEWALVFWPQLGVDTVQDFVYVERDAMENSAAWNQLCEAHKNIIGTLFGVTPAGYPRWVESAKACLQGLCRNRIYVQSQFNQECMMLKLLHDINESNHITSQDYARVRPAEVKMPLIPWKFLPDPGTAWNYNP